MPSKKQHDFETYRMARSLDALAEYEEFYESLLPKLRRMVIEDWPADKIRKNFAPLIQALMIQTALLPGRNQWKALKDTLDRSEGTPIKRTENKTTYAKMDKAELAVLVLQKLKDAKLIDEEGKIPQ